MAALSLPLGSLIFFENASAWQALTEHNRSSAILDIQRIERTQRMSNGTLRKIFIADKNILSVSWTALPSYASMTVDGLWGAMNIKDFYQTTGQGVVKVKVSPNNTSTRTKEMTMSFTSANFTLTKRNVKTGGIVKTSKITAISYAAGVTTYTGANSFSVGDKVEISGATFAGHNGTFTIATATATLFTIAGTKSETPTTSTASARTAPPEPQEFWDVSISLEEV